MEKAAAVAMEESRGAGRRARPRAFKEDSLLADPAKMFISLCPGLATSAMVGLAHAASDSGSGWPLDQRALWHTASQRGAPPVFSLMEILTRPIEINGTDTTSYAVPCHVARRAVLRASSDSDSEIALLLLAGCAAARMPRPSPLGTCGNLS